MEVDWILAKLRKFLTKVETFSNLLENFRENNFNEKQKEYLANIFAVTGGAIILTVWQQVFPLSNLVKINAFECVTLGLIGFSTILAGLWLHGNRRTRNEFNNNYSL